MGLDIFSQYTNYSPVSVPEVGNVLMPVLTDYRFALLGVNKTATDVDAYLAAHKDKQEFLTKYGLTPKLRGGQVRSAITVLEHYARFSDDASLVPVFGKEGSRYGEVICSMEVTDGQGHDFYYPITSVKVDTQTSYQVGRELGVPKEVWSSIGLIVDNEGLQQSVDARAYKTSADKDSNNPVIDIHWNGYLSAPIRLPQAQAFVNKDDEGNERIAEYISDYDGVHMAFTRETILPNTTVTIRDEEMNEFLGLTPNYSMIIYGGAQSVFGEHLNP